MYFIYIKSCSSVFSLIDIQLKQFVPPGYLKQGTALPVHFPFINAAISATLPMNTS